MTKGTRTVTCKAIEVSNFEMERARGYMEEEGWRPTDEEVFAMALNIRKRMAACNMSSREAFFDIMH